MRYIRVTRNDASGGYTVDLVGLMNSIDGEFDNLQFQEVGTAITLTVVELPEEEYQALPEFMGW